MATNPELERAFDYVSQTDRHLYLTGKAGTGKTTFLHRIRAEVPKRMAVVAPTGVAAINAKGVTIHSLFQLPFGVLLPGVATERSRKFSPKKRDLIRGLDLLVIDEISMVRADVLDGIDEVLRRIRRNNKPFGGLQLLMIGDLHQLPPVVRDSDWYQMRDHYETAYFFGSKALRNARPATIQLRHIYRQQDEVFIGLLNKVRNNDMGKEVLAKLNERYQKDFDPADDEGYITLTSHNNAANGINQRKLAGVKTKAHRFQAEVSGKFPESMYPNAPNLEFKVGAQVMFNKNDTLEHLYFNGKIGTITEIRGATIRVKCPGDTASILVEPVDWENRKFELNPETKVIEDHVIGTYTQHPLRLAWAITIHKSQGLTFEKVVIDAADAFAHGQVYVALSRCKTFDGIVLRSRIGDRSVRTDAVVSSYSEAARDNQPTDEDLLADKRTFQLNCLRDFFNADALRGAAGRLKRALLENQRYLTGNATLEYLPLHERIIGEVTTVSKKFVPHINKYGQDEALPEHHPELQTRLTGAAGYFLGKLADLRPGVEALEVSADNVKISQAVRERHDEMKRELALMEKLFRSLREKYEPLSFVRVRADAGMDYDQQQSQTGGSRKKSVVPKDIPHPALYKSLFEWRSSYAEIEDIRPSSVIPSKALMEINYVLPTSKKSLLRIKGFGAIRYDRVGAEVLNIIKDYLAGKPIATDNMEFAQGAKTKEDTKAITLQLYQAGNDVAAIADARSMTEGTIRTHLAYWIGLGDVDANDFMDEADLMTILEYQAANPEVKMKETIDHFNAKYTYDDLRIAYAHGNFVRITQ